MFIPVSRKVFRWGTPDPEGDWIMYGYLVLQQAGNVMIDPPLVPELLESVSRMGGIDAVILTTLDHTRGARYISRKSGAKLLIPDQSESLAVNPVAILEQKEIRGFVKYGGEKIYGLSPVRLTVEAEREKEIPWLDEYALLTENGELIVGDIAIGTHDHNIMIAPEWFPHDPPHKPYAPAESKFREIARDSGAITLLPTHGNMIIGRLQDLI